MYWTLTVPPLCHFYSTESVLMSAFPLKYTDELSNKNVELPFYKPQAVSCLSVASAGYNRLFCCC